MTKGIWGCIIGLCMVITMSCGGKNAIPGKVLPPKQMQLVLWDVIQTQSYTDLFIKKDSLKNLPLENAKLQAQVFALHKTTKEQFNESYQFYRTHPELMQPLLDSIAVKAEREKYKTLYNNDKR